MGKKIVLLGTAQSSVSLAPYHDRSWEIWACSVGTASQPRISRRFELHRWDPKDHNRFDPNYVAYLQRYDGEVYMAQHYPDIPGCRIIDWRGLVRKYSPYFFTSTIAWMFAMAIDEEPDAIHLYGIDMGAMTEYKDQRMGLQYFALLAQSKGIDVFAPPEADVFAPAPLYGICETSHQWWKQRKRLISMTQQVHDLQAEIEQRTTMLRHIQGALDEQDYNFRSWFGNENALSEDWTRPAQCLDLDFPHNTVINGEPDKTITGVDMADGLDERVVFNVHDDRLKGARNIVLPDSDDTNKTPVTDMTMMGSDEQE